MLSDSQLGVIVNLLGVGVFLLVVGYNYLNAAPSQ
jgi:hypothetical protein